MSTRIIEKNELETLLPHKGKMFLLSRVKDYDTENYTIETEFDVSTECIFYENGLGIPDWTSFEVMAQSISALTGICDRLKGIPPKAGCLLSVSNFKSEKKYFKDGETLKIKAEEEFRDYDSGIYRYSCRLYTKDVQTPCTTATITVMETENLQSLLKT